MKLLFIQISNTEGIAAPLTDDCVKLLQDSIAVKVERNWDGLITSVTDLDKELNMSIIDAGSILPPKLSKTAMLGQLEQSKQKLTAEIEQLDKHIAEMSKI